MTFTSNDTELNFKYSYFNAKLFLKKLMVLLELQKILLLNDYIATVFVPLKL